MFTKIHTLLLLPILLLAFSQTGNATLIDTSVNGSLTFSGDPSNYFDPAYGFVPASGYLNVAGTTVTISDTAVEFGFDDGSNLISADFSNNELNVTDRVAIAGFNNGFQMTFADAAFTGQYLIPISDTFPFFNHSVISDVIELDYAGGNALGATLNAKFLIAPVPEPSPACVLVIAVIAFAFTAHIRRRIWVQRQPG